jgi:uncharacterized membrane protein YsdA (DUF1294 family)
VIAMTLIALTLLLLATLALALYGLLLALDRFAAARHRRRNRQKLDW